MLLSIDRVLQLLAEGKPLSKIAQLSHCNEEEVVDVINQARQILLEHHKPLVKKKIVIRKRKQEKEREPSRREETVLTGGEFAAIPFRSTLTVYVSGLSQGKDLESAIGAIIHDQEGRQVGKISQRIPSMPELFAGMKAVERALDVASYFETRILRIRTDSEIMLKQITGEITVTSSIAVKIIERIHELENKMPNCKLELVTKHLNEKARYMASLALKED